MTTNTKRPPIVHQLKSWPEPFAATWSGKKQYDVRTADRDFRVGDYLLLQEYVPESTSPYTGRCMVALITYITPPEHWGLPSDLCVLGIEVVDRQEPSAP
jgi:hypothetical protein